MSLNHGVSLNQGLAESLYLPGRWSAVVTPGAVLLVEPGLNADDLWAAWLAASSPSVTTADLLAVVTAARRAGRAPGGQPPAFALAVREDDAVRVVARPGVPVGTGDERGPSQVVATRGYGPWAEEVVPAPSRLWLGRASASARPDVLPIGTGIVLADVVAWAPGRQAVSARSPRREARTGAAGAAYVTSGATGAREDVSAHDVSAQDVAAQDAAPAWAPPPPPPPPPVSTAPPAEQPVQNGTVASAPPEPAEVSLFKLAEPEREPAPVPEPEPEQPVQPEVTFAPAPEPEPPQPEPWSASLPETLWEQPGSRVQASPPPPPAEEPRPLSGGGLPSFDDLLRAPAPPRTQAPSGGAAHAAADVPSEREPDLTQQEFMPQEFMPADLDQADLVQADLVQSPPIQPPPMQPPPMQPPPMQPPAVGRLRFSDGSRYDVDGVLRIGRAPSLPRKGAGGAEAVAVRVNRPAVSRNHLEVRAEGTEVVVVDLGSANGTLLTYPGDRATRMVPHHPYVLAPGTVLTLAPDLEVVFEGAGV